MHPVIRAALDDAADTFGPDKVTFTELPDGSVKVTVSGRDIGEGWEPQVVSITTTLLTTFPSPAALSVLPGGRPAEDRRDNGLQHEDRHHRRHRRDPAVGPPAGRTTGKPFPALICGIVAWLRSR